jgi:hypothetical protein
MAEPTAARIKPIRVPHCSLCAIFPLSFAAFELKKPPLKQAPVFPDHFQSGCRLRFFCRKYSTANRILAKKRTKKRVGAFKTWLKDCLIHKYRRVQ